MQALGHQHGQNLKRCLSGIAPAVPNLISSLPHLFQAVIHNLYLLVAVYTHPYHPTVTGCPTSDQIAAKAISGPRWPLSGLWLYLSHSCSPGSALSGGIRPHCPILPRIHLITVVSSITARNSIWQLKSWHIKGIHLVDFF